MRWQAYDLGVAKADATRFARDLSNERPDAMCPARVEEICRAIAEETVRPNRDFLPPPAWRPGEGWPG